MTDETASKAEFTAQLIATSVRLSQILNITLDDAVSLVVKFGGAVTAAEAMRKSAS